MTEILAKTADSLILRFALRKHEFLLHGERVTMHELDTQPAFSRKPASLADMGGGALERVFIFDRVEMDTTGFDAFARNLSRDQEWLVGRSACLPIQGARACVMVTSPNRPILFVDTQGSGYARYVARLG